MARIVTCPNCGRKNIDKLNVCRGCGLSLGGTVNSKKEQESTQATENDKHEVKDAEFSNLMECPDCKREISRNAPHCPGCGTPISAIPTEKPKTSNTKKKTSPLTWTLACLVGLALILSFTQKDREGSKPRSAISPSRVAHSPITKPSTPKLNHTYRYLGKTNSEIVAIFGGKPNKVGNVIFDDGTTKVLFESSNGTHISYIDVQFRESEPCSQTRGFDPGIFLSSLGIELSELRLIRQRNHSHTFDHPASKTRVTVVCSWEGSPITVGLGKKYFGTP